MQERDMRRRVDHFLRTRLRSMVMPATLGLGLALGGCNSDGLSTDDGGDAVVKKDAGNADNGAVAIYSAVVPDAAPNADTGIAVRYMAQMPDAAPDLGMVALYLAQIPTPRG
jgi:hypothetical protein